MKDWEREMRRLSDHFTAYRRIGIDLRVRCVCVCVLMSCQWLCAYRISCMNFGEEECRVHYKGN